MCNWQLFYFMKLQPVLNKASRITVVYLVIFFFRNLFESQTTLNYFFKVFFFNYVDVPPNLNKPMPICVQKLL